MKQCNMTAEYAVIHEIPLHGDGWLTFRRLILILSSVFGLTATFISVSLILLHATHYSKPWEQKHIIRIMTLPPIYAIMAWFSFKFYHEAMYLNIVQLVYEAIVVASFYLLMCHWLAPDHQSQIDFFRKRSPPKWFMLTRCGVKRPKSGETWFNVITITVFQYILIRPVLALVSLITQATHRYCNESLSPEFAHIWVSAISFICVGVAMWGVANLFTETRHELASHNPGSKLFALKMVVFFTNIQTLVISLATSRYTSTPRLSVQDIHIGLPATLICIEMAIFSAMHIFTYPWQAYRLDRNAGALKYNGGTMGRRALVDAYNPVDLIKPFFHGLKWTFGRDKQSQYSTQANSRSVGAQKRYERDVAADGEKGFAGH